MELFKIRKSRLIKRINTRKRKWLCRVIWVIPHTELSFKIERGAHAITEKGVCEGKRLEMMRFYSDAVLHEFPAEFLFKRVPD